jgi:hypothetical protein
MASRLIGQEFAFVTPGATNNGASAPLVVRINEWMAANTSTVADPRRWRFR